MGRFPLDRLNMVLVLLKRMAGRVDVCCPCMVKTGLETLDAEESAVPWPPDTFQLRRENPQAHRRHALF